MTAGKIDFPGQHPQNRPLTVRNECESRFRRDVKTTMTITSAGYSMEHTEASAKLAAVVDRAALELGQKKPVWLTVGGASDGNAFSGAGLGVVDAMGVCSGNLHTPEKEFVDLTTVTPRVRLGRKVLELLAQAH